MGSVHSKSVSPFGSVGSFMEYQRVIYHLSRGDLIEIQRNRYKHWVICESIDQNGNVWCFHVTGVDDPELCRVDENSDAINFRKEVAFNGKALLKYEPLEDILRDNSTGIESLCRINNQKRMAQQMLTTVNNQMPDLDLMFATLHRYKDSVLKYDLKTLNCEHYSTFWKYGIGWSSQVNTFQDIISAGLKMLSTTSRIMANIADKSGCYRIGMVCLLISVFAEIAAKVVEGIDFTLSGLLIEKIVRQAIAY